MFVRPNWKDIKAYSGCDTNDGIAWEFIRRNPEYQRDVDLYRAEVVSFASENLKVFQNYGRDNIESMICFHMDEQPGRWRHWSQVSNEKWGLMRPVFTEQSWDGGDLLFPALDYPETFEKAWFGKVDNPRVLIPVDLSEPLEVALKKAEHYIKRLRKDGVERGTVKPETRRTLSKAVYIEYLRILDGVAAGEALQTIGEVISPTACNDPTDKQRDKRIRAAHKAAIKMQDGGFRVLMY